MEKNFWKKLPKPLFVLAPMADVTDAAFRRVIAKYGKPDVMWTEFVSADGLVLAPEQGKKKLLRDLIYTESERPIVAQLFSGQPERMKKAAALVLDLGFDGLDINMGCPDSSIEKQGAGASMIKNPALAREIIRAVQEGVNNQIPISVKTRLGYNKDELETWLPELLAENPAAVTIHARTRKEMSSVPADWDRIKRAVEIRNEKGSEALIIGNGDVLDFDDARKKISETGADGIMFGRAIFGNPWLFANLAHEKDGRHIENPEKVYTKNVISIDQKLTVMLEHTRLFEQLLEHKNFSIMKKHYKAYVSGFDGAAELRTALMAAENSEEVEMIVKQWISEGKVN